MENAYATFIQSASFVQTYEQPIYKETFSDAGNAWNRETTVADNYPPPKQLAQHQQSHISSDNASFAQPYQFEICRMPHHILHQSPYSNRGYALNQELKVRFR